MFVVSASVDSTNHGQKVCFFPLNCFRAELLKIFFLPFPEQYSCIMYLNSVYILLVIVYNLEMI